MILGKPRLGLQGSLEKERLALFRGVSGRTTVQDLFCFCMHMVTCFVFTHTGDSRTPENTWP